MPKRAVPPNLKTPPYVTSQPVITHRKLNFLPLDDGSSPEHSSHASLRFIVLATDGLWDELSSSEVVALVGGHLAGIRGASVPKRELSSLVPTVVSSDALTIEGKDQRKPNSEEGAWAFVDENVSTHLIRNAFGGADTRKLRRLVSIPAPLSRNYRDDVTVTVVWWEDGREGSQKMEETFKIARKEKAKL